MVLGVGVEERRFKTVNRCLEVNVAVQVAVVDLLSSEPFLCDMTPNADPSLMSGGIDICIINSMTC